MRMSRAAESMIEDELGALIERATTWGAETYEDEGIDLFRDDGTRGIVTRMILADGRHVEVYLSIEVHDVTEDLGIDLNDEKELLLS